jgi:hypothetical protein
MQSEQSDVGSGPRPEDELAVTHGADESTDTAEHVEHIHLPPPTIWPFTMAAGISLGFLGLVTNEAISVLGVLLAAYGLVNWVQELRHEPH